MAYKSRKERKRASGGKVAGGNLYNAEGSPAAAAIDAKSDGFKRGGHKKRADGGKVDGEMARSHLAKRARGGKVDREEEKEQERARGGAVHGRGLHAGRARGGSPFSSAHRGGEGPGSSKGTPGESAPTVG